MERKQIELGDTEAICQKWVHSSSSGQYYAGFSVHLSHDALGRYLDERRRDMSDATPASYTWIDWCAPTQHIGISQALVDRMLNEGLDGLQFGMNYDYPATESDEY
jgi:hypothetical protein